MVNVQRYACSDDTNEHDGERERTAVKKLQN